MAATQTTDGGAAFLTQSPKSGVSLLKVNGAGQIEWNQTYAEVDGFFYSLVQAGDGGFALSTSVEDEVNSSFWFAKTDAAGNMWWNQTYAGPGNNTVILYLIATSDNGYALLGNTYPNSSAADLTDSHIWLVKTDAEGIAQWNQTFNGTGDSGAAAGSMVQTGDGGYAILGSAYSRVGEGWSSRTNIIKLGYPAQPSPTPTPQPRTWTILYTIVLAVIVAVAIIVAARFGFRNKKEN